MILSFLNKLSHERNLFMLKPERPLPPLSRSRSDSVLRMNNYFELILLFYLTFCILWSGLYRIIPFIDFSLKTPLRRMTLWLRYAGTALTIAELVFVLLLRPRRRSPGILSLYGICSVAVLSSYFQRQYGYKSNLDSILWMIIFIALFYGAVCHVSARRMRIFSICAYMSVLLLWSVSCALSLVQFALQIGSYGPNHSSSPWLGGYGFNLRQHRLYGIFGYPEYGAVTGLMLILIGIYFFIIIRNILFRVGIAVLNTPLFLYLVLSVSRNAALALYEVTFIGTFLFTWKCWKRTSGKHIALLLGISLGAVLLMHGLYAGTMSAAKNIPPLFNRSKENSASSGSFRSAVLPAGSMKDGQIPDVLIFIPERDSDSGDVDTPAQSVWTCPLPQTGSQLSAGSAAGRMTGIRSKEAGALQLPHRKEDKAKHKDRSNEINLQRKYKEGDLSTGRLKIWKDYFSLYKEIGLFGLSPENAGFYIQEHNPDLFICTYVKSTDEALYKSGYVFHTHSGYLRVFVATGFLGLALLLFFIGLVIRRILRRICCPGPLPLCFLFSLLVCVVGASSALFDNELFFNTNPTAPIFWLSLCILMRSSAWKRQGTRAKAQQSRFAR